MSVDEAQRSGRERLLRTSARHGIPARSALVRVFAARAFAQPRSNVDISIKLPIPDAGTLIALRVGTRSNMMGIANVAHYTKPCHLRALPWLRCPCKDHNHKHRLPKHVHGYLPRW